MLTKLLNLLDNNKSSVIFMATAVFFYFLNYANKNDESKKCLNVTNINVSPESDLGKQILEMDKSEENMMIYDIKNMLKNNTTTRTEAIVGLTNYMSLWGKQPSRKFPMLRKFIAELDDEEKQEKLQGQEQEKQEQEQEKQEQEKQEQLSILDELEE